VSFIDDKKEYGIFQQDSAAAADTVIHWLSYVTFWGQNNYSHSLWLAHPPDLTPCTLTCGEGEKQNVQIIHT
jgi:hypothetical protein